jgi:Domain of unknown function (DUF4333)
MASRTARLLAVAMLAVAVAACTKSLDTDGLESKLKTQIEAQTDSTITGVECPDDIKVESGATFECTATEESGATFTIEVVQTDDAGNVTWEVTGAQPGATGASGASGATGATGASGA